MIKTEILEMRYAAWFAHRQLRQAVRHSVIHSPFCLTFSEFKFKVHRVLLLDYFSLL